MITFNEKSDDGIEREACIVVDGAYSGINKDLENYLRNEGINDIDLIIATHIDEDHIAGLKYFLRDYIKKGKFGLKNYWGPAPKDYRPITIAEFVSYMPDIDEFGIENLSFISQSVDTNEKLYGFVKNVIGGDNIWHPSVKNRDSIPKIFNSVKIDILAPDKQIPSRDIVGKNEIELGNILSANLEIDLKELKNTVNEAASESDRTANNQSIVFKLTPLDDDGQEIEGCSFLFTGDAEKESWECMIGKWGGELESEVLKVAHHGSKTGTTTEVLEKVKPNYCIICVGNNSYGLPDEEVLKMIDEKDAEIFCTGRNPKAGESPCTTDDVLDKCSLWDKTDGKDILYDRIIFEVDTDTMSLSPPLDINCCSVDWKNFER